MSESEAALKAWVECWAEAGPRLEAVRHAELRALDQQDHAKMIDAVIEIACQYGVPRTTSGLVEQQRLFGRLVK